jgi:hypothetical protein
LCGNRIALAAHLDRLGDACEPRQALRCRSAGDDTELHFGLTDLRASNGNAVMTGHGNFHAAAQCGSVKGSDDRLAAIFNSRKQRKQTGPAGLS